ncbi:hypothetical protein, partial [Pseudomonas aeruginosa]
FDPYQARRQQAHQHVAFQLLPEPRDRARFRGPAIPNEGCEVFAATGQFRVTGQGGLAPVLGDG